MGALEYEDVLFFIESEFAFIVKLDKSKLPLNKHLKDFYGWDSLAAYQLFLSVENKFPVDIDPKHFFQCDTLQHIVNYIVSLNNKKI